MQATPETLASLEALQEADRSRLRARIALEELPQPEQIKLVQARREDIGAKREKIESMRLAEEARMDSFAEEDESLAQKQAATQAKIEESKGDFRSVQSLTRDLEGIAKRRETLEFEMGKIDKKLEEIAEVAAKAGRAMAQASAQEAKLQQEYAEQKLQLEASAADADRRRSELASTIPQDVLALYEEALDRCGGVGLAHLDEGRCSACRNVIEPNRLLQVKREAPLSSCPNCRRVLIVG